MSSCFDSKLISILFKILTISVFTTSFQAILPIVNDLNNSLKTYENSSSELIFITSKCIGGIDVNDFDIEKTIKKHPEWLGLDNQVKEREDIINNLIDKAEEDLINTYPFTYKNYDAIKTLNNVEIVYGFLNINVFYVNNITNNSKYDVLGSICISNDAFNLLTSYFGNITYGRLPHVDEDEFIINNLAHKTFNFDINTNISLVVELDAKKFPIVGIYSNLLPEYLDRGSIIITNIETIWRILDVPYEKRRYNGMVLKLKDPKTVIEITNDIFNNYPEIFIFWQDKRLLTSFKNMKSMVKIYNEFAFIVLIITSFLIILLDVIQIYERLDFMKKKVINGKEKLVTSNLYKTSIITTFAGYFIGVFFSFISGPFIVRIFLPQNIATIFKISPIIPCFQYLLYLPLLLIFLLILSIFLSHVFFINMRIYKK